MRIFRQTGRLNGPQIMEWTSRLPDLCGKHLDGQDKLKFKLTLAAEEVLLKCVQAYGEDCLCSFSATRLWGDLTFTAAVAGPQLNPLLTEDDSELSHDILRYMGIGPTYRYFYGKNRISATVAMKKKPNMLRDLLIATILALLTIWALSLAPEATSLLVYGEILAPLFTKLISIMSELATPLVFLSVIVGIIGIGDVASFGRIGKSVSLRMLNTYLFSAAMVGLAGAAVFGFGDGGAEAGSAWGQIVQLVLDIVPDNLVTPFADDNDLQVITLAIFIGVVMLLVAESIKGLTSLVKEASYLVNKMMMLVCRLIPFIVYLGVVNISHIGELRSMLSLYQVALVFIISVMLVIGFVVARTKLMTKVPLKTLFKKQLPSLLINIATSSQIAAYPASVECCVKDFGISEKIVNFGMPLGVVVYMPNGAAMLAAAVWFMLPAAGIPVTVSAAIKLLILAVIIAIAAPPIPGSGIVILPIFFSAMSIPDMMMPVAIIIVTVLGYLLPAMNGFCLQLELLMAGYKLDMVDRDALFKETKAEQ